MIYVANINTEKNTAKSSPKVTYLKLTKGLIYRCSFQFPRGPSGLVGLAVFQGLFQMWPSSVGEYFIADDETINFDDLFIFEDAPYDLAIKTYNEDETYDHVVSVRIGLVSKEVFQARFLPLTSHEYLAELMLDLATERKELEMLQRQLLSDAPLEWQLAIVPVKDYGVT